MKDKYSFYLQNNNKLFNSDILVVCYEADESEISEYNLTSKSIILFIKSEEINFATLNKDVNYRNIIKKAFDKKDVFLRLQCECLLGMYGDSHCDCEQQRLDSIKLISKHNGIYIHIPQEAQGWGLPYKIKELELQVSGRTQDGKYIGIKNRDDAQKLLLGNEKFQDNRNYKIISDILKNLGLKKNKFILLTDSQRKLDDIKTTGLNVIGYKEYNSNSINVNNLSEYLIKILNGTHAFSQEVLDTILSLIIDRQYNERTLSTLVSIVNKIKYDKNYYLDNVSKKKILNAYNTIICGDEKEYYIGDDNTIKIQNNFCCRVNTSIFKVIKNVLGKNIFDRISLEKLYYFQNKYSNEIVKIRTSKILDIRDDNSEFFKGQHHAEQRIINKDKNKIIQKEVTVSSLKSYFENPNYDYVKRVEMITIISEFDMPGVKVFIKRIPTIDNRVLDVFGKKKDIKEFLDKIIKSNPKVLLNKVTDTRFEDENFTDYNLKFADINAIIEEELKIFNILK